MLRTTCGPSHDMMVTYDLVSTAFTVPAIRYPALQIAELQPAIMQVGNYAVDHASWGRPEDLTGPRPYYSNLAGSSDLAGTVVAALAAASCAMNKTDAKLAASYLQAAVVSI